MILNSLNFLNFYFNENENNEKFINIFRKNILFSLQNFLNDRDEHIVHQTLLFFENWIHAPSDLQNNVFFNKSFQQQIGSLLTNESKHVQIACFDFIAFILQENEDFLPCFVNFEVIEKLLEIICFYRFNVYLTSALTLMFAILEISNEPIFAEIMSKYDIISVLNLNLENSSCQTIISLSLDCLLIIIEKEIRMNENTWQKIQLNFPSWQVEFLEKIKNDKNFVVRKKIGKIIKHITRQNDFYDVT